MATITAKLAQMLGLGVPLLQGDPLDEHQSKLVKRWVTFMAARKCAEMSGLK